MAITSLEPELSVNESGNESHPWVGRGSMQTDRATADRGANCLAGPLARNSDSEIDTEGPDDSGEMIHCPGDTTSASRNRKPIEYPDPIRILGFQPI